MHSGALERYHEWFSCFVQEHAEPDAQEQRNIVVKEEHTRRVCCTARRIAADLGLDRRAASLAEIIALFHDIGRFPQYRRYRTFEDSRSVNHAVLGAKVLLERNVLRGLPGEERSLVVRAIALHNVFTLPRGVSGDILLHARIIRDADKLDIWRVFMELAGTDPAFWPSAVARGLPDRPVCSPAILACLETRTLARLSDLQTLNDFTLLQLAWIYDLNFALSFRMVRERGVIAQLSRTLPRASEIDRALESLEQYVGEKLAGTMP